VALVAALVCVPAVLACSTPVFQYALEYWSADLYDVVISEHGPVRPGIMTAAMAVVQGEGEGVANIALRSREEADLASGEARLTVRFPGHPPGMAPLWTGPWSADSLRSIVDSPLRDRLADELLRGATAVFLFLPCGEEEADQAARARLLATLDELSRTLELPPQDEGLTGITEDSSAPVAPAIRLPVLDVPRDAPAEDFLRAMLRASEPDLADLREPMVFPVFGRGRLLYAIVGRGINRDVLAETCMFLTAACSCQVKAQNPGIDLLLRADWERVLGALPVVEEELPPLSGLAAASTAPEVLPPEPPPSAVVTPEAPRVRVARRTALVAGVLIGAVFAGTLAVLLRGGRRDDP
jgi:hypothetical protein